MNTSKCESFAEALRFISETYGKGALQDGRWLIALLHDVLPGGRKERSVLKSAFKLNIPKALDDACDKDKTEQQRLMARQVKILVEDFAIKQETAEEVLWTLAEILGWEKPPSCETIISKAQATGLYNKTIGGSHRHFAEVTLLIEPSGALDTPYIFEDISGGALPAAFVLSVEKGIQECLKAGPLEGLPVAGVKVLLADGSAHPIDSSEFAFKQAAISAFKDGFMRADPVVR